MRGRDSESQHSDTPKCPRGHFLGSCARSNYDKCNLLRNSACREFESVHKFVQAAPHIVSENLSRENDACIILKGGNVGLEKCRLTPTLRAKSISIYHMFICIKYPYKHNAVRCVFIGAILLEIHLKRL